MIGLITWGQPSEATGSRHERGRRVWRPGGVRGDNKTVVRPALETVALTRKPEAGLEVAELKMLRPVCVDACEGDRGIQETDLFVSETVIIISSVCATYQTIPAEGALCAPVHLCRRTGRWSSAPHFLKASVPTCRLLYVATLQTLTGLSYCFLTKLRAICI